MEKIAYIRTGGQTGVDRAALDISRKYNIPIVGWCPKNGWAEDMPNPPGILEKFPELKETPSEDVSQRTKWNVRDSHATLIINPKKSSFSKGTSLTEQCAIKFKRPYLEVHSGKSSIEVIHWLDTLGYGLTLNVGGPRESECPNAYKKAIKILDEIINHFNNTE
ncbi:hypothetical protein M9Y10_028700 [Tritrichomonas musculus]|uniref:Molybdenum carrier n=1 Tax=Tritrichomonas musculus TaxID=1915356 RepID=A0ABR2KK28_9EUKA